jgi:putative two-component system response regulator
VLFRSLIRDSETLRDIPVIMLTGNGDAELKSLALSLGAHDLLSKPVSEEELLARLRSALHLKAVQDDLKEMNASLELKVAERTAEIETSHLEIVWRLAKVGELRDGATGNHIVRVGCYARFIAEALGLPRGVVKLLFLTAPLHDIGKVAIPDAILQKPGPLTPAERLVMQDHCAIGSQLLLEDPVGMQPFLEWQGHDSEYSLIPNTANQLLTMAASTAMTHHERWDGNGYPTGLAGNDIPLDGRIAALADVFDALCSDRPYKPAMPEQDALEILKAESGIHFDPQVVDAFSRAFRDAREVRARFRDEVDRKSVV